MQPQPNPTWQPPAPRKRQHRSMNIYLPDPLAERMERAPGKPNWSAICQRAIESALDVLEAATRRTPRNDGGSDASTVPFSYGD